MGLRLAVFEGLLFPLLVLDVLLGLFWGILLNLFVRWDWLTATPLSLPALAENLIPAISFSDDNSRVLLIITLASSAVVNFLIVRRVWRAVNKTTATDSIPLAAVGGKKKSDRYWKWFGITVLTVAALLVCLVVVGFVIPNMMRERKAALVQHQREEAVKKFGPVIPYVPPSNPEFGPVTELTLPVHANGYSDTLDADSGKIIATPEMETPWEWTTTLLPNGIMIIPQTTANPTILAGTSTLVCSMPAGPDYWDGRMALIDAAASGGLGVSLGQTVMTSSEGELPRVFSFTTPLGKRGLLQVSSLTENPRGVKIRYKLVQNVDAIAKQTLLPTGTATPTNSVLLAEAVRRFHARYATDLIGKDQPPLTEAEVLAAIRWAMTDRAKLLVADDTFRTLGRVVETRWLPDNFELEAETGYQPNNSVTFDVWSVRLRIPGGPNLTGTTCISIRENILGSRTIGKHEQAVIQKWATNWSTVPVIGAPTYDEERKTAAARDAAESRD